MGMNTTEEQISVWATWQYKFLGFSLRTVQRRTSSMRRLAAWCAPLPLAQADAEMIEGWLATFPHPTTRRAYLSDAARFYGWAIKRGICTVDPTAAIEAPKEPQRLPRPIPEHVAAQALATANDARVRLALSLALYAGLRRAEICGLDAEDIDLEGKVPTLTVRHGKGGKDRTVPVHPALAVELAVFAPRRGPIITRLSGGRLSVSALSALISAHMEAVGSHHRLHGGRHRFGTILAEATGGDLQVVAELMGHVNLSTTRGYAALSGARTAAAVAHMPDVA